MMGKIFLLWLVVVGCFFALDVDRRELAENARRVNFINYTGPHGRRLGMANLRALGESLALIRQTNRETFHPDMRYSVIRAVTPEVSTKFDADILIMHARARIFHVRYIQALLSFYLARTFSYTPEDNDVLAWFIVYYNATHRGSWVFFTNRYKDNVVRFLDRRRVGLARRYSEWPGRTQIVIPLSRAPFDQSLRLDALALGDQRTIEELRRQPDRAVEQRRELVEVQREQVARDEAAIEEARQEVQQERREIAEQREAIAQRETELRQREAEVARERAEAANLPPGPERERAQQEVAREEQAAQQERQAIAAEREAVAQRETQVAAQERQVEQAQQRVDQAEQQIAAEEQRIARDEVATNLPLRAEQLEERERELAQREQELAQRETNIVQQEQTIRDGLPEDIMGGKLYYLKIQGYFPDGHYSNEMMIIDPVGRRVVLTSPYRSIGGQEFDFSPEGVVVIGFEPMRTGTVATRGRDGTRVIVGHQGPPIDNYVLVMLNTTNLGLRYVGTDTIFWRSFVEVRGTNIYVIVPEGNRYHLARFDLLFRKQAQSVEPVDPNTFISFFGDEVFVNSPGREILVLDGQTLGVRERIRP